MPRIPLAPFAAALLAASLCLPAAAQDNSPAPADSDDGYSLIEEGAKLLFRGLMDEMEPTLRDMGAALDDIRPELEAMGPKLKQLVDLMGDVRHYEAPERLENGDILIRRNADAPPPPALPEGLAPKVTPPAPGAPYSPLNPGPDGAIDL